MLAFWSENYNVKILFKAGEAVNILSLDPLLIAMKLSDSEALLLMKL